MRRGRHDGLVAVLLAVVLALGGAGSPLAWAAGADDGTPSQPVAQPAEAGDASAKVGDAATVLAWPQFKGPGATGTTTAATPTVAATLAWSATPDGKVGFSSRSDPLIVGDSLYLAESDGGASVLYQLSCDDGRTSASLALDASIDSTSRAVYDQDAGLILVPLHGGQVEAVRIGADGLAKAWTSALQDRDEQTLTTPLLSGGRLYLGTTDGSSPSRKGHLVCLDAASGAVVWSLSQETGYYWSGAAMTNVGLLIGDDAGTLTLRSPDTGAEIAHVDLGGPIRSTTVLSDDGSMAYAVTRDDGTLHVVDVAALAAGKSADQVDHAIRFCDYSTSTPTIVDGVAYVGGLTGGAGGIFAVNVSDPNNLSVRASASSLLTGEKVGEVKSTPLVSVQGGERYVYFTANSKPGAIYVYHLGESGFHQLFVPEQAEYCFSSVVCDAEGSLYYTNDSSVLFKVVPSDGSSTQRGSSPEGGSRAGTGSGANASTAVESDLGSPQGGVQRQSTGGRDGEDPGESGQRAGGGAEGNASGTSEGTSDDPAEAGGEHDEAIGSDGPPSDGEAAGRQNAVAQPDDGAAQPAEADPAPDSARAIPLWPIVGIVVGVVAIVLALAWPKLSERWHCRGRHA